MHGIRVLLVSALLFMTGSAVLYGVQTEPDRFDVAKINQVITKSLDGIVDKFSKIDTFQYKFDTSATNIVADKFKVNFTSRLVDSPWGDDPVDVKGSIGIVVRPEGGDGLELMFSESLESDPLAIIKHIATDHSTCPVPDSVQGFLRVHKEEDCKIVDSIVESHSLKEIEKVIRKHIRDSNKANQRYVKGLKNDLKRVKNHTVKSLLKQKLIRAKALKQDMKKTKVTNIEDGFQVSLVRIRLDKGITLKDLKLTLTGSGLKFSGKVFTPKGASVYDALEGEIDSFFKRLETSDEFAVEFVKMKARMGLSLIEKMLHKPTSSVE